MARRNNGVYTVFGINAKMNKFKIRILDQYWITKNPDNKIDLCSHGLIDLRVNDNCISDETDDDWTINTAGLMLLRTVESDHYVDDTYPIIPYCGQLGMIGCPISIDWTVEHQDDNVIIKDIKKYPTTDGKEVIEYKGVIVEIGKIQYAREVVRFCDSIKDYFKGKERDFKNDYNKQEWESFWQEFNNLLEKNRLILNKH